MTKNEYLQCLCRQYLHRLRHMARKHGIDVDGLIRANKRQECQATQHEVEMLSRCVNDERLSRKNIPRIVGQSYRQCCENGVFDKIKTLKRVGIYSKVGALLFKERVKE